MGYSKGEFSLSNPVSFLRQFLQYVETVGIFDEYDEASNQMVTSQGVKNLINEARKAIPERVTPTKAARLMRDLTEAERNQLIKAAREGSVADMRVEFQQRMAANGGAMGILQKMVKAIDNGEYDISVQLLEDAQKLVKGIE